MNTRTLWGVSIAISLLGTWLLFDAMPGANWIVWVSAASLGLIWTVRRQGTPSRAMLLTGLAAMVISGAAAVTASPVITVLICGSVILYLAMQMLLSAEEGGLRLTLSFAVTAPFVAFVRAVFEALRRGVGLTNEARSPGAAAALRGAALTVPVLIVFALLLSNADPMFAAWRVAIEEQLESFSYLPRMFFFFGLLTIVVGAYGFAASARPVQVRGPARDLRILGPTERMILLGSVATLFWIFLAVQLSYLFGTSPAEPGSGITFAEYARRGFAELTVVSTSAALLIILGEVFGRAEHRRKSLRAITFAVLLAVFLLLASALNRVLLYEEAYGHTVARLYGKTFMIAVALGLLALCLEVGGEFNSGRLFRRTMAVVTTLFIGLAYWNHEAWIVDKNIERYASMGQLDVPYLIRELSSDAVPAVAAGLHELPPEIRDTIRAEMQDHYSGRARMFGGSWYEWNLSRVRARRALATDFGVTFP